MGIPGQFTNPVLLAALDRILKACKDAGKPCICFTTTTDGIREGFEKDYDSMTFNIDTGLLIHACRDKLAQFKDRLLYCEEIIMREEIIEKVKQEKLIAIVRGIKPELCLKVAQALYDGGVHLVEVTYDQKDPSSWIQTAEAIQTVAEHFEGRMLVGAGTITSVELVELTFNHKGQYIISPDTDIDVIKRTRELGLVSMPGALTPSEIKQAYNAGADFVKLFPAGNLGAGYLKAIKAPLNHIPILAVGGISDKNVAEFLKAGADGFGIGGNLAKKDWIDAGEFDKLTEAAKATVAAIQGA